MASTTAAGVLLLISVVLGRIYFEENFDDDSWKHRWVTPTYNGTKFGKFERTTYYSDHNNTGLRTMEAHEEYALSTKFPPFNSANKSLVLQFIVKQSPYCVNDARLRLYDCNIEPTDTYKDTPYLLTFGPERCGSIGLSVNFLQSEPFERKITREYDQSTHVYTLIVEPDMTYQVLIDGKNIAVDEPIFQLLRGNNANGLRNDFAIFPTICGIGLVFDQGQGAAIFDNILLSDDVGAVERKREAMLQNLDGLEWFRTSWLVDITLEDLTRILKSDKNIEFKHNNETNFSFFEEFDKFLVSFNLSDNNFAIKAAAEYNKYHSAYNESIQIWLSFQPRSQDILVDIETVLHVVNDANSIFARTIATVVINYGFLELNRHILPFVNQEVEKVRRKLNSLSVPAPQLALQISDINCQSTQNVQNLQTNLLDFLVIMPMQSGGKYAPMSKQDMLESFLPCLGSAEELKRTNISVLPAYNSIEIDFEKEIYKYEIDYVKTLVGNSRLLIMNARDKMGSKGSVPTNDKPARQMSEDLVSWLYRPLRFSKSHFGGVISWEDKELLDIEPDAPRSIFASFQHLIIDASRNDSENDDRLKVIVQRIANYSVSVKERGGKEEHSDPFSEHNEQIQASILATIDKNNFEFNKRQIDKLISLAREANGISPGTVQTIFFEWLTDTRSKMDSGGEENIAEWTCADAKRSANFLKIMNYAMEMLNKAVDTNTVTIGSVLDEQFWDDQLKQFNRCKTYTIFEVMEVTAFLCKATVRHHDIVKYGGLGAFKIATEQFSLCNYFGRMSPNPRHYYISVIGCVGGHSTLTLFVEYARFMEILNGWAEEENALLFTNAGIELPTKCNDNVQIVEEAECRCGWWIKEDANGKYQDKKTVARQIYEKVKADEENKKTVVPTDSLLWLWVLITVIILGALILVPATFLIFHYRSKYILTKMELDDFIKGRQATRAEPAANGDEEAETRSYNSEKYELPPSAFTIDITSKCLGSGAFGRVYPGYIRRNGQIIEAAVKMANGSLVRKSHGYYLALKGLLSEIKILAYVGEHNHIVALLGSYTKKLRKGEIAVFLELCQLGSLDKYLHSVKPQMVDDHVPFNIETLDSDACSLDGEEIQMGKIQVLDKESSDELVRWAGEIASGMEFLASKKLVHADLATRNVLLTVDKVAKISDFGLSRRLYDYTEYVKQNQAPLPWRWMAPESLRRMVFNEKTDVWAFGVTLWEMFTLGDQPYPGLTWNMDFPALLVRGLRLPEPRFNLKEIYSVMLRCWDISPALRPTFTQLKSELNSLQ